MLRDQLRPQKTKWNPNYSVLIWGAICYEGQVYMERVNGTIKAPDYIDILDRFLNDGITQFYTYRVWEFQHDGAGPHGANDVYDFLRDRKVKLHWHPSLSPDLNAIELIWAYMKQDVEERGPTTKAELEEAIQASWNELPLELIRNCIHHIVEILPRILEFGGAWIQDTVGK